MVPSSRFSLNDERLQVLWEDGSSCTRKIATG